MWNEIWAVNILQCKIKLKYKEKVYIQAELKYRFD